MSGVIDARPVESKEHSWLAAGLCKSGFFSALAREQLDEVLSLMLMVRYEAGTVICAEGEPGDAMYLIYSGTVLVTKEAWTKPVARLQDGDFFGEMALLLGEPRSATVTTEGETEVFCLASEDFQRIVGRSPDMTEALRRLAEARRAELARS